MDFPEPEGPERINGRAERPEEGYDECGLKSGVRAETHSFMKKQVGGGGREGGGGVRKRILFLTFGAINFLSLSVIKVAQ